MKKIYTSNYASIKKFTNKDYIFIGISGTVPDWFKEERLLILAPTWSLVRDYKAGEITEAQYRKEFIALLKRRNINFKHVVKELKNNSVLLCYEKAGEFCHRRIVAQLIEQKTGIIVKELEG